MLKKNEMSSSVYLYVNDDNGDLVTGINDMAIVNEITPDFLSKRLEVINAAKLVVLDCNVSKNTIEWIVQNVNVPIFIDPVSTAKVDRIKNVLDKIDTLKPNELETEVLTGITVVNEKSARNAAKLLNEKGVNNVFISMGSKGILCSRNEEVIIVKPLTNKIISTNGAGDCTMATIIWARFFYGDCLPIEEIGLLTQAAASITLESVYAVAPELSIRNIIKRVQKAN